MKYFYSVALGPYYLKVDEEDTLIHSASEL